MAVLTACSARPVFSSDERRVYRQLREALPHHIVLSKLPMVRFCQPTDPSEVRFWYELLGSIHVTFAICSANGRVLAAIDMQREGVIDHRIPTVREPTPYGRWGDGALVVLLLVATGWLMVAMRFTRCEKTRDSTP